MQRFFERGEELWGDISRGHVPRFEAVEVNEVKGEWSRGEEAALEGKKVVFARPRVLETFKGRGR
jgi:hypothetical protein